MRACNSSKSLISGVVIAAILAVSSWIPAQAAMVSTEQMVSHDSRDAQIEKVQGFLARADVQQHLESWGVAPDQAQSRVAQLSDSELQQLSTKIDQQPAGGDVLVILGVVFLILLVLELVGVTHIFRSF